MKPQISQIFQIHKSTFGLPNGSSRGLISIQYEPEVQLEHIPKLKAALSSALKSSKSRQLLAEIGDRNLTIAPFCTQAVHHVLVSKDFQ